MQKKLQAENWASAVPLTHNFTSRVVTQDLCLKQLSYEACKKYSSLSLSYLCKQIISQPSFAFVQDYLKWKWLNNYAIQFLLTIHYLK